MYMHNVTVNDLNKGDNNNSLADTFTTSYQTLTDIYLASRQIAEMKCFVDSYWNTKTLHKIRREIESTIKPIFIISNLICLDTLSHFNKINNWSGQWFSYVKLYCTFCFNRCFGLGEFV